MKIVIKRIHIKGEVTEGHLYIDELFVCDTIENSTSCLVPGKYPVSLIKCKQHSRKMICISPTSPLNVKRFKTPCDDCPLLDFVGNNTAMPLHCPQLKPGNGVFGRNDGSIIIGERRCFGCIIHPLAAFDSLFNRIRMSLKRGHSVTLEIR